VLIFAAFGHAYIGGSFGACASFILLMFV
jgi:hypothetical protein